MLLQPMIIFMLTTGFTNLLLDSLYTE